MNDRFGLGWRPELAIDLLRHGEQVEILEFIAEDWLAAPPARLATLAAWCRERPCHLHGTSLGLASAAPLAEARLRAWRKLLDAVQPACWSEHLAFVRGGDIELGHLAAPPRTPATQAGAIANLRRIRQIVGSLPLVENVATLMPPPASDLDEPTWVGGIIEASGAPLLLDLHNLHANAINQGWDPLAALARLPLAQVRAVHLAGGRRWRGRILDDHLHPVPDAVFGLLEAVAMQAPGPLDVLIERDGSFPPFSELLAELAHARACVAHGRARRVPGGRASLPVSGILVDGALPPAAPASAATATAVEAWLARLYTDAALRGRFTADPTTTVAALGFPAPVSAALIALDRDGLTLVAESLMAKRRDRQPRG